MLEHLPVAEAQHTIAESAELSIPPSIALELFSICVILPAVQFDHERVADEQIDPTDSWDTNLRPRFHAEHRKSEARNRLGDGLRARVDAKEETTEAAGKPLHLALPLLEGNQFEPKSRVDGSDGEFGADAGRHLREGNASRQAKFIPATLPQPPMRCDPTAEAATVVPGIAESRAISGDFYVKRNPTSCQTVLFGR